MEGLGGRALYGCKQLSVWNAPGSRVRNQYLAVEAKDAAVERLKSDG